MARQGIGSYVAFGEKTPYATDVTASDMEVFFKMGDNSDGLQFDRNRVYFEDLTTQDQISASTTAGQESVSGTITLVPTYGGIQNILRFLTGHNDAVAGSGPYSYAFVPLDYGNASHYWSGTTKRHLGVEVYRNQGTNSTFYQGCEINEFSMSFEADAPVECSIGLIGRTATIGAKSGSPSYKTDPMFTSTGASDVFCTLGGSTFTARSATVTVSNNLESTFGVTAREGDIPAPTGKREIKLDVEVETDDDTLITDLKAGTEYSTNTITLDNGLASSSNREFQWAFDRLILDGPTETSVSGLGTLTASLSFRAISSAAGTPAFSVNIRNGDSDYAS